MIEATAALERCELASIMPRVRIVTGLGDILLELYPAQAPRTVSAFLTVVDAGSFDGGTFWRIVRADNDRGAPTIEVIQGSVAPSVMPCANVGIETTDATGLRHEDGSISLPRNDQGLGSAQSFFLCVGPQPALDAGGGRTSDGLGFAAFGRVIEGMNVVSAIQGIATCDDAPTEYLHGQIATDPVPIYRIMREPEDPEAALRDLADDYWRFRVREFPVDASMAGVRSENRRLDDDSNAAHARRAALCGAMLSRASAIASADLDEEETTTLAVLKEQLELLLAAYALDEHHRPRLFPFGFLSVPTLLAQQIPLGTVVDRDDFIARFEAIPAYLQGHLCQLRHGFAKGHRIARPLIARVLDMLDSDLAEDGLAARVRNRFAETVPAAKPGLLDEQRLRISALLTDAILPTLAEIRGAIANFGEAELTDDISLSSQPDGRAYYLFKVRQQTSTDLDPEIIHAMGVEEVARIRSELEQVLVGMGRPDQLSSVAAALEARVATDADVLLAQTRAFAKKVDGLLPRLFRRMPRITYAVEPFTAAASASLPPALAQPAPADRSMPGIFWLTALPEKLPLHLITALTLHEAWPGHLMQMAIANELQHLPEFRRFTWADYNGYVEGWALYCERLGHDLGLYEDPADHFGLLAFALWRAARLVVDTGIHWKGWSREQAIAYLVETSLLPLATCEAEVDRYIGMPAQALSYKIGERTIVELRAEAEARLGERFSLPDFHDMLLALGPVSLAELRRRARRWMDFQHAGE